MNEDHDLDAETFGEWLHQVSEDRDISEQELLHELMSSYWMIDELSNVMDELSFDDVEGLEDTAESSAGSSDEPDGAEGEGESHSADQPTPADLNSAAGNNIDPSILALIDALREWNEKPTATESASVDRNLIDLIKAIQQGPPPAEAARHTSPSAGGDTSLETIELIKTLMEFSQHSQAGASSPAQAVQLSKLDDRVQDLDETLDQMSRRVDQVDDRSKRRATLLTEALEDLSAQIDELAETPAISEESLENLDSSISQLRDELRGVQDHVDSQFESIGNQFDRVEQILTHLFNRVEENGQQTEEQSALLDDIESELEVLEDIKSVGHLKHQAHDAGIATAACHSCGDTVDIALLSEPNCPACNARFDDIETTSSWFRTKHTLV